MFKYCNVDFLLCPEYKVNIYLKIRHFSGAKPNDNIGAVRKHLFSSAGCCNKIIREFGFNGGFGRAEHQQTISGRLKFNIYIII